MKKRIIKAVIVVALFMATAFIIDTMMVPLTNEMAVNQLSNDNLSFVEMNVLYKFKNLLYLVPTLVGLGLFGGDIKNIIK